MDLFAHWQITHRPDDLFLIVRLIFPLPIGFWRARFVIRNTHGISFKLFQFKDLQFRILEHDKVLWHSGRVIYCARFFIIGFWRPWWFRTNIDHFYYNNITTLQEAIYILVPWQIAHLHPHINVSILQYFYGAFPDLFLITDRC